MDLRVSKTLLGILVRIVMNEPMAVRANEQEVLFGTRPPYREANDVVFLKNLFDFLQSGFAGQDDRSTQAAPVPPIPPHHIRQRLDD